MRLRELRKQRGISQLKLAMDLNMNQNSISRYENGEREADYRTLIAFADYFHVSLDYLLERTNDPEFHGDKHFAWGGAQNGR
jgi:transcriptional regulator with XRE-family HTH domain